MINSSGIGDSHSSSAWRVTAGLTLPTGSIDEKGDTPRAPGNQQIPFSMQLGSGTYDLPFAISCSKKLRSTTWGLYFDAKWRLGENDRNYTLGDRYGVSVLYRWDRLGWIKPTITLSHSEWDSIGGMDDDLLAPGAFPYPAPVTNPDLYGGDRADLSLGLRFTGPNSDYFLEFKISKPIFQNLNGPQNKEDFRLGIFIGF